jgi:FAD/FMN-containing dehydrogenase
MPEWQSWRFDLDDIVGKDHVSTQEADLAALAGAGGLGKMPRALVYPDRTEEVAKLLRFARSQKIAVAQVGAVGCGCEGAEDREGWIALDLKRMARLRHVNKTDLTCEVEAGMVGENLEKALLEKGLTLGRIPDHLAQATVGCWLAGRPAGPWPSPSGRLSDLVLSLEGVLPDGTVFKSRATPRSAAGPDLDQAVIGAEGWIAVVTAAVLAIRPIPAAHASRGFRFADLPAALEVMRAVAQQGWNPAAAWLADERLTRHLAANRRLEPEEARGSLLILAYEGPRSELIQFKAERAFQRAREQGGEELGEGTALNLLRPGADQRRLAVEMATTWSDLMPLVQALRQAVEPRAELFASFFVLGREGVGIRLSLLAKGEEEAEIALDQEVWKKVIEAAVHARAAISHFPGLRLHPAAAAQSSAARDIYQGWKRYLDPENLLNSSSAAPRL